MSQLNNVDDGGDASYAPTDGSALDTTLLESLFYNEMMMLEDSSDLLSSVTGVGHGDSNANKALDEASREVQADEEVQAATASDNPEDQKSDDPVTYAEQSLLRDFGVTGSPIPHISDNRGEHKSGNHHHNNHQQQQQHHAEYQYHAQQHYQEQSHHPHPGQPYHQHPVQSYQQLPGQAYNQTNGHYQLYQSRTQPTQRLSKGIKHDVTPIATQASPVGAHPSPPNLIPNQIPNPLAHRQPSQPPPGHPPQSAYYPHPTPQQHPFQHSRQDYHSVPPAAGAPAPSPPAPGHHQHAAFAPLPVSAPVQPHYSPPSTHRPIVAPAADPPPPPRTPDAHSGHPHALSQAHHPYATTTQPPNQEQLVSQFATLANRLGISLPTDILSALTASAGMTSSSVDAKIKANGSLAGPQVPFVDTDSQAPGYSSRRYSNASSKHSETGSASSAGPESTEPFVNALRKTAEDAVASVTLKRSHEDASKTSPANDAKDDKPSYAKRRKKPRMADCESQLTQLRAENEKLKRHLDNITNQTEKFQQDRIKAEDKMKEMMLNPETPEEELNQVIKEYSEAYSDYGKRRHEELCFHLDQLQKLANPTNFTKMALWTMAKANDSKNLSNQNPLVGILGKELNVTPQQVRKMLVHRQKIRDLCSNLNATMALIHQLSDLCEQKNKKFNDRMTKTREILNPKQVVKLIMWIKDHSDVLGNICPGWTSEQVLKTKETSPSTTNQGTAENPPNATSLIEAARADEPASTTPSTGSQHVSCQVDPDSCESVGSDNQAT